MNSEKSNFQKIKKFLRGFGPGLIPGASDEDPGIITYLQAGAKFSFSTLWTALISFPLMVSMQEMSARIGLVTSQGLTIVNDDFKRCYEFYNSSRIAHHL
jgi:Mn2+/Fe2+ NRAMP family transporter